MSMLVFAGGTGWTRNASAHTPSEISSSSNAHEVHGFVSQGFIKTTANKYLNESDHGSFEFTEAGINTTVMLSDRLHTGMQLFMRDLGPSGNYKAKFDWFYLDYFFFDWLGIRAGRAKTPFGLYNEAKDVDAARVVVLLPQSIYPTSVRDYLLAVTGAHLYGYLPLPPNGGLDYRLYAGTSHLEVDTPPDRPYEVLSLSTPYVLGGRVLWDTPVAGLRLGPSLQALRIEGDLLFDPIAYQPAIEAGTLPSDFRGQVGYELNALFWVVSLEYTLNELLLAAEYSRWTVEVTSAVPALMGAQRAVSERLYVMATYQLWAWLTLGSYYALEYPDVHKRSGRSQYQHDVAATMRFDILPNWLLKIEGHFMIGTARLNRTLNAAPRSQLEREWGIFLAKTTVYF